MIDLTEDGGCLVAELLDPGSQPGEDPAAGDIDGADREPQFGRRVGRARPSTAVSQKARQVDVANSPWTSSAAQRKTWRRYSASKTAVADGSSAGWASSSSWTLVDPLPRSR